MRNDEFNQRLTEFTEWADKLRARTQRPDLTTVARRNAFYSSAEYRNMTTAEKCAVQGDGFLNDYD